MFNNTWLVLDPSMKAPATKQVQIAVGWFTEGVGVNPWNINDQKAIAGFARIQGQYFPAIAAFNGGLQCTVFENPNPNEIKGFRGFRLDASKRCGGRRISTVADRSGLLAGGDLAGGVYGR